MSSEIPQVTNPSMRVSQAMELPPGLKLTVGSA